MNNQAVFAAIIVACMFFIVCLAATLTMRNHRIEQLETYIEENELPVPAYPGDTIDVSVIIGWECN